ncbi:MAG: hypothetical protein ACMXYG_03860 [Candidatus Woesearchaeota archaeon]
MFVLNWPLVLLTTGILYFLTIFFLLFNVVYATLFLFMIIAYWTRLPGVAVPTPYFPVIWVADMVDLFTLIVAINLGGWVGAFFGLFANVWARACGIWPSWRFTMEDALSQFVICFFIPFIHIALGGDIFVSMVAYTLIRGIFLLPLTWFLRVVPITQWAIEWVVGLTAILFINAFYAKLFGDFFDNLMQKGVAFNWTLFLFVTIVILIFYISVFRKTKKVGMNQSLGKIFNRFSRKAVKSIKKKSQQKSLKNDLKQDDDSDSFFVREKLK